MSNNEASDLISQSSNEQFVFDWLIENLNLPIGEGDGLPQYWQVLAGEPEISNAIYLYLNGYYDNVIPVESHVLALLDLLTSLETNVPTIGLTHDQIVHILTFEPGLIEDFETFLSSHNNDEISIQLIHDFLDLQMCVNATPGCQESDFANNFDLFYEFYSNFSDNNFNWLQASTKFIELYGLDASLSEFISMISGSCATCDDFDSFREYSAAILANNKHDELLAAYPEYITSAVDINSFLEQYSSDQYLAAATLFETYVSEINESPSNEYQWQLAMEVFYQELGPILLELTPGIGDLIGAYNDFSEGNYFWGCVGIIATAVPGDEVFKVISKADDIRKRWKKVQAIFHLWDKLLSKPGGQKILSKLPQQWKDLPGSKLADSEKGLKWTKDAHNEIRVMDRVPNSQHITQHVEYVRLKKGGSSLDINGNPVPTTLPNGIKNPNFERDTHIPLSGMTDELLDLFFN